MRQIFAEIITIGDEILYGQTLDTNSHFISEKLSEIGVNVVRKTTVGDEEFKILKAFEEAEGRADIVLITGGLGPTSDDLTKPCLAEYFNTSIKINEQAFEEVKAYFEKRGREFTDLNQRQAALPEACTMISNPVGTAPGMWFEKEGKIFVSMPGVPHEMVHMMENEVLPRLKDFFPLPVIYHKIVKTYGIGESYLADKIRVWEDNLPKHFKLAYLPSLGEVKLRLTALGSDVKSLEEDGEKLVGELKKYADNHIYGYGEISIEAKIGEILAQKKLTLSAAESCTGGYVSHQITSVPGSSRYFLGSMVAYANEIKEAHLNVPESVLTTYGAVSEETVKMMAENVRLKFKTDIGIATSGIAGPSGGTAEKPVGLIWMAYSDGKTTEAKKILSLKDRMFNIQFGSKAMLTFLLRKLMEFN